MEAEAGRWRIQFRLWQLLLLTSLVAFALAVWRLGRPAGALICVSAAMAGILAFAAWLETQKSAGKWAGRCATFIWLVFVAVIAVLSIGVLAVAILVSYPRVQLGPNYIGDSTSKLRSLALAVQNYEAQHGPLPRVIYDETGRPMHSWRALILEQIEEKSLHKRYRFEEPWDSPHNLDIAKNMPWAYRHFLNGSDGDTQAGYLAVFDPDDPNPKLGRFPAAATTVMLVEFPASGILWSEPRDLPLDEFPEWQAIPSSAGGRFGVTNKAEVQIIEPGSKPRDFP